MKISICIPTYNQEQYIEQAIRSAYEQTLTPTEIIVSDDSSTDNTSGILQSLQKEIPILRVVRQPSNLGIARNTDTCLRMATGDFIVRLDSDDYLSPNYVEKLSKLLVAYPQAAYAHAAVQEIDQYSRYTKQRNLFRASGFQADSDALKAAIKGYKVAANIIMFRKFALQKVNYITGRPDYVEDFHLSASFAAAGFGNVYLDEILSYYRVWVDGGKVRQRRKLMELVGIRRVFDDVLEPSFKERNWDLTPLEIRRAIFASQHADCLSWQVYTDQEKMDLADALYQLSSSSRARYFIYLHKNGYGKFINVYNRVVLFFKLRFKSLILRAKLLTP